MFQDVTNSVLTRNRGENETPKPVFAGKGGFVFKPMGFLVLAFLPDVKIQCKRSEEGEKKYLALSSPSDLETMAFFV